MRHAGRASGLLPPDIHLSGEGFTVEADGTAIRVGLSYVKHLSRAAIASILAERCKKPFASVPDLYARTSVEKDELESLIRGGFLDALGGHRDALLEAASSSPKKRSRRHSQRELHLPHPASRERAPRRADYLPLTADRQERMEWEALALNVSHHPLSPYRGALEDLDVVSSSRMLSLPHGTRARAVGLL
jgi:error-prone DNA polymerase